MIINSCLAIGLSLRPLTSSQSFHTTGCYVLQYPSGTILFLSINHHPSTHTHTHSLCLSLTHTYRQLPSHSLEAGVCESRGVWGFGSFFSFGCSKRWWNSRCESLLLALASFHKIPPPLPLTHIHTQTTCTQNHTHFDCWQGISNPSSE